MPRSRHLPIWATSAAFRASRGGALRVAYTPPDGQDVEVRFASRPQAMSQRTGAAISFEVIFDEVQV